MKEITVLLFIENFLSAKAFGSEGYGNGEFSRPCAVAVDKDDNIIVLDSANNRIQVFDKNGEFQKVIMEFEVGARYKEHECRLPFNNTFKDPRCISISKRYDRIFISDSKNHRILVFSPSWKLLFEFGSYGEEVGQMNYPRGLALSNCSQYLYVCDRNNHRIQVFNAFDGSFVKSYGSKGNGREQMDAPCGICVLSSGGVIVSEYGNHRIHIFQ